MKVDLNDNSKLLLGSRNCGVSLVDLSPIYSPPKLVANEYIYPENSRHTCTSVDWFYDSQIFFTADTNGRLVVWNSQSFVPEFSFFPFCDHEHGNGHAERAFLYEASMICSACQMPGEAIFSVITGSYASPCVKICDLRTGSSTHLLKGHKGGITNVSYKQASAFECVSSSLDGTVRLWDIRKPSALSIFKRYARDQNISNHFPTSFCFSLNMPCRLFVIYSNGDIVTWDTQTGKNSVIFTSEADASLSYYPPKIQTSPLDDGIIIHSNRSVLDIRNSQTGDRISSLRLGHTGSITSFTMNAKYDEIYSASLEDSKFCTWKFVKD
ncbi:DNA excision repair protein ERCC-8 [Mitosporidium daphniae]